MFAKRDTDLPKSQDCLLNPICTLLFICVTTIWVVPCLWAYADSTGLDQPAHKRSLSRAFTVRSQNHWILITKTYIYNFDPLKPHFYIVKLGYTWGIHLFSLFLLKNIDCGYSLEPPKRSGSKKYPQSMI